MDKQEIISAVNKIKKEPLAPLKKDVLENSSGTNHKALMQYNAMLDHITIGAGTSTIIEYAGIEFKLRLLTAEEFMDIYKSNIKKMEEEKLFDEIYREYLTVVKTLAVALTPSPFKTEGKAIFNEDDLKLMNYDVLYELGKKYQHFVDLATQKPDHMPNDEITALIELVKKKQTPLTVLNRKQLLTIANYYMNYSQHLEKTVEGALSN
jgi:hypothetical protein